MQKLATVRMLLGIFSNTCAWVLKSFMQLNYRLINAETQAIGIAGDSLQ